MKVKLKYKTDREYEVSAIFLGVTQKVYSYVTTEQAEPMPEIESYPIYHFIIKSKIIQLKRKDIISIK